jgi:adenine-specific DNA-methyltransferase
MMRRGSEAAREDRPSMFYPIYVDTEKHCIIEVGEPIPAGDHKAPEKPDRVAIFLSGAMARKVVGRYRPGS